MMQFVAFKCSSFKCVVLVVALLCFCPFYSFAKEDSKNKTTKSQKGKLFTDAEKIINSGDIEKGIDKLEQCIRLKINADYAEDLLATVYASKTANIIGNRKLDELDDNELLSLEKIYLKIVSLNSAYKEDWLKCFKLLEFQKKNTELALTAQRLLVKLRKLPKEKFSQEWLELFTKLEKLYDKDEFIVFRYQLLRILLVNKVNRKENLKKLKDLKIIIKARLKSLIDKIDVALTIREISRARKLLGQLIYFSPRHSELPKIKKRFKKAYKVNLELKKAREALRNKKHVVATKHCKKVLKDDPSNPVAKNLLAEIARAKTITVSRKLTSNDRFILKKRRMIADLAEAEKEQDILKIKKSLEDLVFLGADENNYRLKLAEIEQEILASRTESEIRFRDAEKLFNAKKWQELYFFLNRNPGLMSSVEKLIKVWEMKLMSNYHLGKLDKAEIEQSANTIISKAKDSFYANFILMKLALADNKFEEAKKYYDIANNAKPGHPDLKIPGQILWVRGEGKVWAIIVLLIGLFISIKLIKPVFKWYESTYWTRIGILKHIFPSFALRSLEKCFGSVTSDERPVLFQNLIWCSLKVKDTAKTLRYAEMLLDISPRDKTAIEIIAKDYLKRPNLDEEQLQLVVNYSLANLEDNDTFAQVGDRIKRAGTVTIAQVDFLNHYVSRFEDDIEMMELIGNSFLSISASDISDSALNLIELAWKRTGSDQLWWNFWRLLMNSGKFAQAQNILEGALNKGKPIEVDKLFGVFEQEVMSEVISIRNVISLMDPGKILEGLKEVPSIRFFNSSMAMELMENLQGLAMEEDHEVKFAAKKALDHIKLQLKRSQAAYTKMMDLQGLSHGASFTEALVPSVDQASNEEQKLEYIEEATTSEETAIVEELVNNVEAEDNIEITQSEENIVPKETIELSEESETDKDEESQKDLFAELDSIANIDYDEVQSEDENDDPTPGKSIFDDL